MAFCLCFSLPDVVKVVQALLNRSEVYLPDKNLKLESEEVFVMVSSNENYQVRDLYMMYDQERDANFHLDIVKEPLVFMMVM